MTLSLKSGVSVPCGISRHKAEDCPRASEGVKSVALTQCSSGVSRKKLRTESFSFSKIRGAPDSYVIISKIKWIFISVKQLILLRSIIDEKLIFLKEGSTD